MRFEFIGLTSNPTCIGFAFRDASGFKAEIQPDWQRQNEFTVSTQTLGANITSEEREEMYAVALWAEEHAEDFIQDFWR